MVFLLYIFTNLESVVPFQLFQTDTMYLKYVLHERMYMTFRGALFNIYICRTSCGTSFQKIHLLPPTKEVWGKVMFLHLSVILCTQGKGSAQLLWMQTPRGCRSPWMQNPPPSNTVNKWAVCILLECTLVILSRNSLMYPNITKTIFGGVQVRFQ